MSGIRDSRKVGSLWGDDGRCGRSKEVSTPELIGEGSLWGDDGRCGRSKEVSTPELIGERVRVTLLMF